MNYKAKADWPGRPHNFAYGLMQVPYSLWKGVGEQGLWSESIGNIPRILKSDMAEKLKQEVGWSKQQVELYLGNGAS